MVLSEVLAGSHAFDGPAATVLVQTGTLKVGDIVVTGDEWGRVRALINDKGEQLKEAPPSLPVEILGMQGTPLAGDRFAVVENESKAREISEYRQRLAREKQGGVLVSLLESQAGRQDRILGVVGEWRIGGQDRASWRSSASASARISSAPSP